jgi:hypothetical protein
LLQKAWRIKKASGARNINAANAGQGHAQAQNACRTAQKNGISPTLK